MFFSLSGRGGSDGDSYTFWGPEGGGGGGESTSEPQLAD